MSRGKHRGLLVPLVNMRNVLRILGGVDKPTRDDSTSLAQVMHRAYRGHSPGGPTYYRSLRPHYSERRLRRDGSNRYFDFRLVLAFLERIRWCNAWMVSGHASCETCQKKPGIDDRRRVAASPKLVQTAMTSTWAIILFH